MKTRNGVRDEKGVFLAGEKRGSADGEPSTLQDPQLDPKSDQFDVNRYIAHAYSRHSFVELGQELERLKQVNQDTDNQKKLMVMEHFNEFLSCHQILQKVSETLKEKPLFNIQDCLNGMKELDQLTKDRLTPILERMEKIRKYKNTITVLDRYQKMFDLPSQMNQNLHEKQYRKMIENYKQLQMYHETLPSSSLFDQVFEAGKRMAEKAQAILLQTLDDPTLSIEEQKHAAFELSQLGLTEEDPLIMCLHRGLERMQSKMQQLVECDPTDATMVVRNVLEALRALEKGLWSLLIQAKRQDQRRRTKGIGHSLRLFASISETALGIAQRSQASCASSYYTKEVMKHVRDIVDLYDRLNSGQDGFKDVEKCQRKYQVRWQELLESSCRQCIVLYQRTPHEIMFSVTFDQLDALVEQKKEKRWLVWNENVGQNGSACHQASSPDDSIVARQFETSWLAFMDVLQSQCPLTPLSKKQFAEALKDIFQETLDNGISKYGAFLSTYVARDCIDASKQERKCLLALVNHIYLRNEVLPNLLVHAKGIFASDMKTEPLRKLLLQAEDDLIERFCRFKENQIFQCLEDGVIAQESMDQEDESHAMKGKAWAGLLPARQYIFEMLLLLVTARVQVQECLSSCTNQLGGEMEEDAYDLRIIKKLVVALSNKWHALLLLVHDSILPMGSYLRSAQLYLEGMYIHHVLDSLNVPCDTTRRGLQGQFVSIFTKRFNDSIGLTIEAITEKCQELLEQLKIQTNLYMESLIHA